MHSEIRNVVLKSAQMFRKWVGVCTLYMGCFHKNLNFTKYKNLKIFDWVLKYADIKTHEVTLKNALYFATDLLASGNGINSNTNFPFLG